MSDKVVRLKRSLYGLKQASRSCPNHLVSHMKSLGVEQSPADACVMRLVESGSVSILAVVHVEDIFAVGRKSRCDHFCDDLNRSVPINKLGELKWYAGCHFSRVLEAGILKFHNKLLLKTLLRSLALVRVGELHSQPV